MKAQNIYIMEFDDHKRHVTENKPLPGLTGFVAFKQVFSKDLTDSSNSTIPSAVSYDMETLLKFHQAAELNGLSEHWGKLDAKLSEALSQIEGTSLSKKLLPR